MERKLDDEARAELLCFLVVGQIFAFAREGVWLRTDHLIESAQIWLALNGAECDWLERARLEAASRTIAAEESGVPFPEGDADCTGSSTCAPVGFSTIVHRSCNAFTHVALLT
ncbi:hypothetical protein C7401_1544 [Paraburkholderia unamae]|uniref:hypothetical protein n=1 Tax=Paraburkholderia unamae TaxID=219649 RepID=UPI000DC6105A|nr:hypothetical protein [Paraburkholderia unamae]RAR47964.1 hypothetical protein C7401_1544 [Paraburkholderia unamae]